MGKQKQFPGTENLHLTGREILVPKFLGKTGKLKGDPTDRKVLCVNESGDMIALFTFSVTEPIGQIPQIHQICVKWDK